MKRLWKIITVFAMIFMSVFIVKTDSHAEVIWNTAGEKSPTGRDFTYKHWSGLNWNYAGKGPSYIPELIDVTYEVTYCYEEAYAMNSYVNAERRAAGVPEVEMKDELMDVAMKRAAETALCWDHVRPSGLGCSTVSMFVSGENLHRGADTAKGANESLAKSEGHYENMIDESWKYAGYGCVKVNGYYYWVQIFSHANKYYEDGYDRENPENCKPVEWDKMTCSKKENYKDTFTAKVDPEFISLMARSDENIYAGEPVKCRVYTYYYVKSHNIEITVPLTADQYDVQILTPEILSYKDGVITGKKKGTGKVKLTLKADSSLTTTLEIKIKKNTFQADGNTYKITDFENRTAQLTKAATNKKSVKIPKEVKLSGMPGKYKVTSIAAKAFKNNKKVTGITIGSNVSGIGREAFRGCKNLKKITINSTKLKSVGKNALKGIHRKAVIKVKNSKLKDYKTLFKGKGQKKSVKIIKK